MNIIEVNIADVIVSILFLLYIIFFVWLDFSEFILEYFIKRGIKKWIKT